MDTTRAQNNDITANVAKTLKAFARLEPIHQVSRHLLGHVKDRMQAHQRCLSIRRNQVLVDCYEKSKDGRNSDSKDAEASPAPNPPPALRICQTQGQQQKRRHRSKKHSQKHQDGGNLLHRQLATIFMWSTPCECHSSVMMFPKMAITPGCGDGWFPLG